MSEPSDHPLAEAEALFRARLAQDSYDVAALIGLAGLALAVGRTGVAATLLDRAALRAGPIEALWLDTGVGCLQRGDAPGARRAFAAVAALTPGFAAALYYLGLVFRDHGAREAGLLWCLRAGIADPGHSHALSDAADIQRLLGRPDLAAGTLLMLLAHVPDRALAWFNFGTLVDGRLPAGAARFYDHAVTLQPGFTEAHYNAGALAMADRRYGDAVRHLARALALYPTHGGAWNNLAAVRREQGLLDRAVAAFRRGDAVDGRATSNLILTLAMIDGPAADRTARDWGRRFPPLPRPPRVAPAGRRLRIGYLSPDMRLHSCAYFLEPLFDRHDTAAFEVFAYADIVAPDPVSHRLAAAVEHWRQVGALDDETLAALIAADGIDILVDLAGHTAGNRLPLFARRPAPVQVSWLGYNATTGLPQIDWRLVDDRIAPPAGREWFSERLWSLGASAHCWRPPVDAPEPVDRLPDPAGIVFGSFNALHKLGDATLGLWARLLARLPGSRLLLKGGAGDDRAARTRLLATMAGHGVDPLRIEIRGWQADPRAHLALYGEIDIALDPFPYNGTTTTCEALWMGVPVVTLIGDRLLSRIGYGLVDAVGLGELAAASEDDYVDRAVVLAEAPGRLRTLRRDLRRRMAASPLRDEAGFARSVEAAFAAMMGEPEGS